MDFHLPNASFIRTSCASDDRSAWFSEVNLAELADSLPQAWLSIDAVLHNYPM